MQVLEVLRKGTLLYHYTESGLKNIWLKNGFSVHKTSHGKGVAIVDADALHAVIGIAITRRPKMTGAELRFLRKEMGLSQSGLAEIVGSTEQSVSLWERKGRIPVAADRLIKLMYVEQKQGNVKIQAMIERLAHQDQVAHERMLFGHNKIWREAA